MGNQIVQIIERVGYAYDKNQLMKIVDEVSTLSETYDDNEIVDLLCYIITTTEYLDVRFHALDVLYKVKGR